MRNALMNIISNPENQVQQYQLFGFKQNNCQDFNDRLRKEYERLTKQLDKEHQR